MTRSVGTLNGSYCYSGNDRGSSKLVIQDMAAIFCNDLLTGFGMHFDGDLVAHAAGRNPQSRLFFKDLSGALLQPVDSRIITKNIVTHLGIGHRFTHGIGWFCNCVAAEIDHELSGLSL